MKINSKRSKITKEICWNATYETTMNIIQNYVNQASKNSLTIALKTISGQEYYTSIPDFMDFETSDFKENLLIQQLINDGDTNVLLCLCTMNGKTPEIPSWHLRNRLIEINPENLNTMVFLWGGGDTVFVKPFSALLPPK